MRRNPFNNDDGRKYFQIISMIWLVCLFLSLLTSSAIIAALVGAAYYLWTGEHLAQ